MKSINFDRAASFYDATRKLPSDAEEKAVAVLLEQIRAVDADRVLEIGIGTGRIARPLAAAEVRMTGVDISTGMMRKLQEQVTVGQIEPDLLLGDGAHLPLGDDSFRAALVVHVLHLVPSMEGVVAEIRRVLAHGGVFLQHTRGAAAAEQSFWTEVSDMWDALLLARGFTRRHRPRPDEIREVIRASGASLEVIEAGEEAHVLTVAEELAAVRTRTFSWMWEVPDELMDAALPEYEAWLLERFGSPEAEIVDRQTFEIEVWRWA